MTWNQRWPFSREGSCLSWKSGVSQHFPHGPGKNGTGCLNWTESTGFKWWFMVVNEDTIWLIPVNHGSHIIVVHGDEWRFSWFMAISSETFGKWIVNCHLRSTFCLGFHHLKSQELDFSGALAMSWKKSPVFSVVKCWWIQYSHALALETGNCAKHSSYGSVRHVLKNCVEITVPKNATLLPRFQVRMP